MTRILVTGASGFVGGAFMARHAGRADVELHGIGRRPLDHLPNYTRHDLTKPLELDFQPDVVVHAAARSLPWGSRQEFHRQNVEATRQVLEYCHRRGVEHFIYISSSSVFYREADQLDITERSSIGPEFVNHYARTKYEGELLAKAFPGRHVILRPRAVFGPGDTVLFPRILRAAREGKLVRLIRPGPPASGDLIYIDSLCDYMLPAALDPGVSGDFNLTNGHPVEIESFLREIFLRLGVEPPTRAIPCARALRLATVLEAFYKVFLPRVEPPITRFGIGVLAYSKTFQVDKALAAFGPPSVGFQEGVDAFIAWQKERMKD